MIEMRTALSSLARSAGEGDREAVEGAYGRAALHTSKYRTGRG